MNQAAETQGQKPPIKTELDCHLNPEAICPYCGKEQDGDYLERPDEEEAVECRNPECGREFTRIMEVRVTWTTLPEGGWPECPTCGSEKPELEPTCETHDAKRSRAGSERKASDE